MDVKLCKRCGEEKSLDQYNKNGKRKDGVQTYCRQCQQGYDKRGYEKHQAVRRLKNNAYRKRANDAVRSLLLDLKRSGCRICNESEPICLDFHHCHGKKDFNIADAIRHMYTVERVRQEVLKCILVCSNCHRKIHGRLIDCKDYLGVD